MKYENAESLEAVTHTHTHTSVSTERTEIIYLTKASYILEE